MGKSVRKKSVCNVIGRIVAVSFLVIVLVVMLKNDAYAAVTEVTIGDYTYSLDDSTLTAVVKGYVGAGGNISIPATVTDGVKTYSVVTIGGDAFCDCESLTGVTIPDGVKFISTSAFRGCSNLRDVRIPDSVTTMNSFIFGNCSSLTSVTIPDSVMTLGDGIFSGCSSLTSAILPSHVTEINRYTFEGCSSLTSVTIPTNVTVIETEAFEGCSSLASITLPNNVTGIEARAFRNCGSLSSIFIPENVTSIGMNAFFGCNGLETGYYPEGLSITDSQLSECGASIISYNSNANDTVMLTVENIQSGITALELPATLNGKTVTTIQCVDGVNKLPIAPGTPVQSRNVVCSSDDKVQDVVLTGDWVWKDTDKDKELISSTSITATAIYDGIDKAIYNTTEVLVTFNTEHMGGTTLKNEKATSCKETGYTGDVYCLTCDNLLNSGSVIPKSTSHTYAEGVPTTKATFTDTGIMTYTCTVCTIETKTEEIPILSTPSDSITTSCSKKKVGNLSLLPNWNWKDSDKDKELIVGTPITAVAVYQGADKSNYSTTEYTITITINHGDNKTTKDAKTASCKEDGYTGDTWCVDCNTKVSDGSVIPKNENHSYDGGTVTKMATVTEKGIKTYTCTVCKNTKTEDIAKLPEPQEEPKREPEVKPEAKPEVKPEKETEELPQMEETEELPQVEETPETDETGEDSKDINSEDTKPAITPDDTEKEKGFNVLFVVIPVIVLAVAGGGAVVFIKKKK